MATNKPIALTVVLRVVYAMRTTAKYCNFLIIFIVLEYLYTHKDNPAWLKYH
jgi:hypothetical protein